MELCKDIHTHSRGIQHLQAVSKCALTVLTRCSFVVTMVTLNYCIASATQPAVSKETTFALATAPVSAWEDGKPGWIVALTALI